MAWTPAPFKPSGAFAAKGLVPAPSTTAGTAKYLREDATWVTPGVPSVTVVASVPLIGLGSIGSFTVTVPGATVGQAAIVNPPSGLLASLSWWTGNVTAANTVTITLKSSIAISAGNQTFVVGVL